MNSNQTPIRDRVLVICGFNQVVVDGVYGRDAHLILPVSFILLEGAVSVRWVREVLEDDAGIYTIATRSLRVFKAQGEQKQWQERHKTNLGSTTFGLHDGNCQHCR